MITLQLASVLAIATMATAAARAKIDVTAGKYAAYIAAGLSFAATSESSPWIDST